MLLSPGSLVSPVVCNTGVNVGKTSLSRIFSVNPAKVGAVGTKNVVVSKTDSDVEGIFDVVVVMVVVDVVVVVVEDVVVVVVVVVVVIVVVVLLVVVVVVAVGVVVSTSSSTVAVVGNSVVVSFSSSSSSLKLVFGLNRFLSETLNRDLSSLGRNLVVGFLFKLFSMNLSNSCLSSSSSPKTFIISSMSGSGFSIGLPGRKGRRRRRLVNRSLMERTGFSVSASVSIMFSSSSSSSLDSSVVVGVGKGSFRNLVLGLENRVPGFLDSTSN